MKFGQLLQEEMYPPYAEGYVKYNELKAQIAAGEPGFGERLRAETERVAVYAENLRDGVTQRLAGADKHWRTVQKWQQSGYSDIRSEVDKCFEEFTEISHEIKRVLDFVSLNVTGIRKICKKHDRRTGEVSGPLLLRRLQRDAEAGYLDRLSDVTKLEPLVTQCLEALEEIREAKDKSGGIFSMQGELAPIERPDYNTIPRSREPSTNSSEFTLPILDEFITQNCVGLLAKPLLNEETTEIPESPITAFVAAFWSGVTIGGFWTICEVVLTPWAATWAVLGAACGSITGSRPALSSLYPATFAFAGACATAVYSSAYVDDDLVTNKHPMIGVMCAWLMGTCLGAWTVQLPRQLVNNESPSWIRAGISVAPMIGSCVGASILLLIQVKVARFAEVVAFGWLLFGLLIMYSRPLETPEEPILGREHADTQTEVDVESAKDNESLLDILDPTRNAKKWEQASKRIVTWGVLLSLSVDRTVRTLVALEVVSFFPALWGEDFFLLSVGSILAALVGAVVPSWACALIGCVSIYLLSGPGFIAWLWVEASCRNDLMHFGPEAAPTADTILYVADAIACLIFALELSYLEMPDETPTAVNYASGVLLLISSLGRLIASRL